MLRATWRGLLARKLRLLLASLSVLLGISFAAGSFVLTDSIGKSFDKLFATINSSTAVTIQGVSAFGGSSFDGTDREPVPQAVLDRVRKVPGVSSAVGGVGELATLVLPNGKAYKSSGPPVLGTSFDAGSPLEQLTVVRGRAPRGLHEVVLDAHTIDRQHLKLGDVIGVIGNGGQDKATIVGIGRFGQTNSLLGATLLAFDPPSAQQLFGTPGTWTSIEVAADPGVSDEDLRDRIAAVLPAKKFQVLTGEASAAQQSSDIKKGIGFFNTFLQVFATVALLVGAFLIFNTFAMLVTQRTRELALMRALGASRGQVMRSVQSEAVAVGLIGGLGGLGLGILVASGIQSLMNALGVEIPKGGTVVETRTVVYCLVMGLVVTMVAAAIPARRAGRMAPVQALRESGPAEPKSLKRRTLVGAVVVLLGVVQLVTGLSAGRLATVGLGAAITFIGVALVSPIVARPLVGVLAAPFARIGIPGRLGRGNAMRNPRRTSTTAAALMIGLALVAAIGTLGSSAKKSVVQTVATSVGADYVLHTSQFQGLPPTVATALQSRPELAEVAAFTQAPVKIGASRHGVQGVDPKALQSVLKLTVLSGDLAGLRDDQLAISKAAAKDLNAKVGQQVKLTWGKTGTQPMTIGAVYDTNQFAGNYIVTAHEFAQNVTSKLVTVVAVRAASSASPAESRRAIETALKQYPQVEIEDQAAFVKSQGDQINQILNVITLLLGLSVVIALLGVVNTLALSVIERTRELGLLRAVGLSRTQLKRMIRVESFAIAVFGALLGVAVGLAFGWALVDALHDEGITEFAIPWGRIVLVLLVAALGGVVAAALPARRGARLNILQAISEP